MSDQSAHDPKLWQVQHVLLADEAPPELVGEFIRIVNHPLLPVLRYYVAELFHHDFDPAQLSGVVNWLCFRHGLDEWDGWQVRIGRLVELLRAAIDPTAPAGEQTTPAARAIALLLSAASNGRPWTVKEIAATVGVPRTRLYRDRHFKALVQALRAKTGTPPPQGQKDAAGNLDAWEEDE